MGNSNPQLEIRSIDQLNGRFRIPAYQRGYRWERRQVEQLLDDLLQHSKSPSNYNKPYYLQPIVVAPAPEDMVKLPEDQQYDYDLIDGQQRLTTILLIFKALQSAKAFSFEDALELTKSDKQEASLRLTLSGNLQGVDTTIGYELMYQTRKESRTFINTISEKNISVPEDKHLTTMAPDHLYMWHAYNIIRKWIYEHPGDVKALSEVLKNNVRLIWYELAEAIPNWKKFKDLNAGKIPLTNSELIKALVLKREKKTDLPDYEQDTIVAQWDEIERELSDAKFWKFLTKKPMSDYPTKIDLLFDLLAGKTESMKKDEFFTFRYFFDLFARHKASGLTGKENWVYIHERYRRIRDWFTNPWMYHRIGYLVAVGDESTLRDIYLTAYPEDETPLTHSALRTEIEEKIKKSLAEVQNLMDLRYGEHPAQIKKVLTLYNVLIADSLSEMGVRYPFDKHNDDKEKGGWSLEHVHAQNSEDLKKLSEWQTWVSDQLQSLQRIKPQLQGHPGYTQQRYDHLITKMEKFIASNSSTKDEYTEIVTDFTELTNVNGGNSSKYDMHSIVNMALLLKDDNSMLNKSTFDVKRMKIASKSSTNFVPIGTERVFMKAIPGCDTSQMFFWGDTDREAYLNDIEEKIGNYLPKPIQSNDATDSEQ